MFLILHGQTELNVAGRAQGRSDSPLTLKGRREGEAVGSKLAEMLGAERPRRILCSPLGRSRATAAIIAERLDIAPGEIAVDPRLDEVDLGAWEGLTQKEIRQGWPGEMREATPDDWYFRAPGGERFADVERRMRAWLAEIGDHDRLVVVGHGISSRVMRGLYANLGPQPALQLDVDRDAVFVLEDKDVAKIRAR
jgi:probable phosphoglycerate mutase